MKRFILINNPIVISTTSTRRNKSQSSLLLLLFQIRNNNNINVNLTNIRYLSTPPPTTTTTNKSPPLSSTILTTNIPGLTAASLTMLTGFYLANEILGPALLHYQGISNTLNSPSPISGIPVSILLGIGLHQIIPKQTIMKILKPGLAVATKPILQLGIVCVGMKLSLNDLISTGLMSIPAVMASVGVGLTFVPWFGKQMGLSEKMSNLIAAGTSICGVTAITAVAPAIKANEQEMSVAIANVVCFGTAGMLLYPYLAHSIFNSSEQIGIFLGLAVHDTSQVIGSALTYQNVYHDNQVLNTAAVTKLTRNLCLAGVVPYFAIQAAAASAATNNSSTHHQPQISLISSLKKYTPIFVLGFIGASAIRSVGDFSLANNEIFNNLAFGLWNKQDWIYIHKTIGDVIGTKYLLGTAMAGVGLSTNLSSLQGVGIKPFVVGFIGASTVAFTGFCSATVIGMFI
jgi:uncharacterized integral membrane protein (TIGR00698 family)